MGISEMIFVGSFTLICLGASVGISNIYITEARNKAKVVKREMEYWKKESKEQEALKSRWREQSNSWKQHFEASERVNHEYKRMIAELQRSRNTQQSGGGIAPKDKEIVVKALKKAMFESHPDRNPGKSAEEFIEYNNLYKKLK